MYPLTNYVEDFWAGSFAYTFAGWNAGSPEGTPDGYLGLSSPSTYLITMYNVRYAENISTVTVTGKYDLYFEEENCAVIAGCGEYGP